MNGDSRIEDLVVLWGEQRRQGKNPALEDLCRDCPELLPELKRRAGMLEAMHWLEEPQEEVEADGLSLPDLVGVSQAERLVKESGTFESILPRQTGEAFERALTDLGLVTESEVDRVRQRAEGELNTSADLAYELLRRGKLTTFQIELLAEEKGESLVFGNYILREPLGVGGMGEVFKAWHKRMKRIVALKMVSHDSATSWPTVERFYREVEALARLDHRNIVTAYDADEVNGQHFLVMECVDGVDLKSLVVQQGPLTIGQAIDCLIQTAYGLEYAHERGIIHRDIKPSNLLVDRQGTVKILDLGLARMESANEDISDGKDLTGQGTVMGTANYMPPEQALDTHSADARSDIYSLGCTLHFLLTGEQVFPRSSLMETMLAHRESSVPSLRGRRPETPECLEAIFTKMLAKKPTDRQPSMTVLLVELQACAKLAEVIPGASSTAFLFDDHAVELRLRNAGSTGISDTVNETGEPGFQVTKVMVPSTFFPGLRGIGATLVVLVLGVVVGFALWGTHSFESVRASEGEWVASLSSEGRDRAKSRLNKKHILVPSPTENADRAVALWAHELGATVAIAQGKEGQSIEPNEELPNEPFTLFMLDFADVKNLTDADLAHVHDLPNLQYLNLSNCPITDAGLAHLDNLPILHRIYLCRTKVGDLGCRGLARFPSLVEIQLVGSSVTTEGVADLQKALPEAKIVDGLPE